MSSSISPMQGLLVPCPRALARVEVAFGAITFLIHYHWLTMGFLIQVCQNTLGMGWNNLAPGPKMPPQKPVALTYLCTWRISKP